MASKAAAVSSWRRRTKRRAVQYLGGACVRCGYNKAMRALTFHHKDPATKGYGVADSGLTRGWDRLQIELDKCEVLCLNCHAEEHDTPG